MDEILDAEDVVLAQIGLNDLVVGEGDALLIDLAVSTLVDEFPDGLEVGLAVGNIGLNQSEHLLSGAGSLHKDAVVDLEEAEELEDFAGLGSDLIDTTAKFSGLRDMRLAWRHSPTNTDNKVDLWLGWDVEITGRPCSALETNLILLLGGVLLNILFSTLEDHLAFGLGSLEGRELEIRLDRQRLQMFSPERWLIQGIIDDRNRLAIGRRNECIINMFRRLKTHLASLRGSSEALFPGLFVLLALLEESLRDFDGLTKLFQRKFSPSNTVSAD